MAQSTYSLSFDGTNDYLDAGNVPVGGLTTVSVSLWAKAVGTTSLSFGLESVLIGKNVGAPIALVFSSSEVAFNINGFGGPTTSGFTLNTWHHILGVFVSGVKWVIYLDGVLSNSSSGSATLNSNSHSLTIGNLLNSGDTTNGQEFQGKIDDVFVWSTDQSSNAAGLANGSTDPSTLTGKVGCWRIEEGSGTTTSDSSGNGNTATLTNGPTWSTDVPTPLQGAAPDDLAWRRPHTAEAADAAEEPGRRSTWLAAIGPAHSVSDAIPWLRPAQRPDESLPAPQPPSRAAWLAALGPQHSVSDPLPWLRAPARDVVPVPATDSPAARAWSPGLSPAPAAADSLAWRRRPDPAADPGPSPADVSQPRSAALFSPQQARLDDLAWLARPRPADYVQPAPIEAFRRSSPALFGLLAPVAEPLAWLRRMRGPDAERLAQPDAPRRPWLAAIGPQAPPVTPPPASAPTVHLVGRLTLAELTGRAETPRLRGRAEPLELQGTN